MRNESSRTTNATASGTVYDEVVIYPFGVQDRALVCIPMGKAAGQDAVVAICAHGAGGTEETINSTAMTTTRDLMLDRGWIIMSAFAHDRAWSNADAQRDYQRLYRWAASYWQVTDVVLHGQSMGGLTMANIASRDAVPRIRGVVCIDAAVNLASAWASTGFKPQIRSAYGIVEDATYSDVTTGYDPCLVDEQRFAGKRFFLSASPADVSIPKAQNSDLFHSRLVGVADDVVYVTGSGGHVEATNYFPNEAVAFLASGVIGEPTEELAPLPFGMTKGNLWAFVNDELVQLAPGV